MSEIEIDQYENTTAVSVPEPSPTRSIRVLTRRMRITLFVHGVVLPSVLMAMVVTGQSPLGEQPWQSGELRVYAAMLLHPRALLPFALPILYAMLSLGTWTVAPATGRMAWVRIGLYTGVLLSLHFMVLSFFVFNWGMLVTALIVLPCWHLTLWGVNYYCRRQISIWHIMTFMTLCALLFIAIQYWGTQLLILPWFAIVMCLIATPILNAVAYIWAARVIYTLDVVGKVREHTGVIASLIAVLTAWAIGWRFAIVAMLDEYSRLPPTNPNCYLSNAAAYGHPWLTRAKRRGDVTDCMRRLKFLELVFKVSMPKTHRLCRQTYDATCPPLARVCQSNIYIATATCLLLKPLELLAELLRLTLRIERLQVRSIYGQQI